MTAPGPEATHASSFVALDGNIKFYGGEPTLHSESLLKAMRFLRARGFAGLCTIYSNGVKARTLMHLLESDPQSEAVLHLFYLSGARCRPTAGACQSPPGGVGTGPSPAALF